MKLDHGANQAERNYLNMCGDMQRDEEAEAQCREYIPPFLAKQQQVQQTVQVPLSPVYLPEFKPRHPLSQRFHEILKQLGGLHDKKQQDYGRDNDPFANVRSTQDWGQPAWVGAMIRAQDKLKRLQAYAAKGTLANEGVEDSFLDLAVYSIIGLVLWEEEHRAS